MTYIFLMVKKTWSLDHVFSSMVVNIVDNIMIFTFYLLWAKAVEWLTRYNDRKPYDIGMINTND